MHARARISGVLVGGGVPAWGSVPPTPAGGGQGPRVKAAVGDASSLLLRFLSSYVSGGSPNLRTAQGPSIYSPQATEGWGK